MKKLAFLLLILLLFIAAFLFFWYFQKPDKGTITQNLNSKDLQSLMDNSKNQGQQNAVNPVYQSVKNGEEIASIHPLEFKGTTFNVSYPSNYQIKADSPQTPQELDRLMLSTTDSFSHKFSVVVEHTTNASYDNIPSVSLRRTRKDVYTEVPITIGGRTGISFESTGDQGYEKDAFILYNGTLATVVFSSAANADTNDEFDSFTKTIVWK